MVPKLVKEIQMPILCHAKDLIALMMLLNIVLYARMIMLNYAKVVNPITYWLLIKHNVKHVVLVKVEQHVRLMLMEILSVANFLILMILNLNQKKKNLQLKLILKLFYL